MRRRKWQAAQPEHHRDGDREGEDTEAEEPPTPRGGRARDEQQ